LDGTVYVADSGSDRVARFGQNGTPLFPWWTNSGALTYFSGMRGVVVLSSGQIGVVHGSTFETFTPDGGHISTTVLQSPGLPLNSGCAVLPDGLVLGFGGYQSLTAQVFDLNGVSTSLPFNSYGTNASVACDANSTIYLVLWNPMNDPTNATVVGLTRIYGRDMALNHTALPIPYITSTVQRTNSSLVDIDYVVQDAGTATVKTAVIAFKGDNTETLGNLVRMTLFAEGTGGNVGSNMLTGVSHRLTWDASEGTTNFGNFSFEAMASDGRTMLPLHFITLPSWQGQTNMVMSSRYVSDSDLLNLWFWLVGTGDGAIALTNGTVVGVGGPYDGQTLASGTSTTSAGRSFLYQRLNVRSPTTDEIARAQSGNYGFYWVDGNSVVKLP
jgi:hypothetical protein